MDEQSRVLTTVRSGPGDAGASRLPRDRGGQATRIRQHLRRDRWMTLGVLIVLVVAAAAILVPVLPLPDPDTTHSANRLAAPGELGYPLGSDQLGRDILSRLVWGARVSLMVGFVSAGLAVIVGGALGLIAGYFGGAADNIIMRVVEIGRAHV